MMREVTNFFLVLCFVMERLVFGSFAIYTE